MKTKRNIKKARHTSFRVPGNVDAIITAHQKRTGLPYTKIICDLILWTHYLEQTDKLPVHRLAFEKSLAEVK